MTGSGGSLATSLGGGKAHGSQSLVKDAGRRLLSCRAVSVYSLSMTVIADSAALAAFCRRAGKAEFITVDTEFIRDRTYWPRLCLVQIADPEEAVAIDPLADGIRLAPLFDLLNDPKVLKVFHAARQDVEIFNKLSGKIPAPIFDTQVAAMVCGFGDSVGYERLVAKFARARIDKGMRFTDWAHRPLSKKQLAYALDDVIHLRVVYQALSARIRQTGRASWLDEEMADLTNPATYRLEPAEAWRRLKARLRKGRHLWILREVAAWREIEAQNRDVPRNRVLRDDLLVDIAVHEPRTPEDLAALRSASRDRPSKAAVQAMLAIVARAKELPEHAYPRLADGAGDVPAAPATVDLLRVLLKLRCDQHGVAQKLVASSEDLAAIASDDRAEVPALHGWRRELFGEDALSLKHGRLALAAKGPNIVVVTNDR
jgi:ribonuclease D